MEAGSSAIVFLREPEEHERLHGHGKAFPMETHSIGITVTHLNLSLNIVRTASNLE
jgi:hypothetical protein